VASHLINVEKASIQLLIIGQLGRYRIQDRTKLDNPGDGQDEAAVFLAPLEVAHQVDARELLWKR
jgi:hypothetical protein